MTTTTMRPSTHWGRSSSKLSGLEPPSLLPHHYQQPYLDDGRHFNKQLPKKYLHNSRTQTSHRVPRCNSYLIQDEDGHQNEKKPEGGSIRWRFLGKHHPPSKTAKKNKNCVVRGWLLGKFIELGVNPKTQSS